MIVPNYQFGPQAKAGKRGELCAAHFLEIRNPGSRVENKANDMYCQKVLHIDLVAYGTRGERSTFEVKNDTKEYPRMFCETLIRKSDGTLEPGCLLLSAADYLIYLFEHTYTSYICRMSTLVEWLRRNQDRLICKGPVRNTEGDRTWEAYGNNPLLDMLLKEGVIKFWTDTQSWYYEEWDD